MIQTAIILAGGLGTRLRSVVPDLPKPMAPVNGRPFLEHQLDFWIRQGITSFILSVGFRREMIIGHFGEAYAGARIRYAVEEEPLGTGGGLLLAAAELPQGEPFLVLNGDTFFDVPLGRLARFHEDKRSDWTFALFRSDEAGRYMGMQIGADGRVVSLRAQPDGTRHSLVNGGVYLIGAGVLEAAGFSAGQKVSLEDDILPALHSAGCRLYGYEVTGKFIDIGVPHDYARAGELLNGMSSGNVSL